MLRYIIGISILTIGIIIVRALSNGKVLRKYQYAFWIAIPLYMLLIPFVKIDVPIADMWNSMFASKNNTSAYEVSEAITPTIVTEVYQFEQGVSDNQYVVNHNEQIVPETIYPYDKMPRNHAAASNVETGGLRKIESILTHGSYGISAVLIIALAAYNIGFISYCRRNRKYIGKEPSGKLEIYSIRHKETPFLLFNKIYIDNDSENINEYVICHEACHYKQGDHLWVLIRYLVLFLNWYNPVIWAAFILAGRDSELACDEKVMKVYGIASSKDYARTLLGLQQLKTNAATVFTLSTGIRSGYKIMKKRIISIKKPARNSRRVLAMSLAAIMLFSSCSFVDNSNNGKKISKNDPWFEANIYDVDSGVNHDKELQDLQQDFAGADDKYMVIYTHGAYLQSARSTNFGGVFYGYVLTVDKATGEVVNKIDVNSSSYKSSDDNVRSVIYSNGIITIRTESKEQDHDPVTGEVLATRSIKRTNQYPSDSIKAGDYMVYVSYNWDNGSCNLEISSPGGDSVATEIAEPDNTINNVFDIIPTGENNALVFASTQKGRRYYELDLSSGKIIKADSKKYEWLNPDRLEDIITGTDGKIYCRTASGLSRIDFSAKTVEELFNYNWCDVNLGYISDWNVEVVDCTGDSLIFVGQIRNISYYEAAQKDFQVIELTRSNKNPHAGKTVLELYAPSMDISIGAAVLDYNANNQKYRIETIYRYNEQDYYSTEDVYNARNTDEDKLLRLSINSHMSNALITDIVAGKGPDILISSESYGQLNNPDYLADLTPYVKDLDPDQYFTNIIEGSKTGTALYQLPVGFFIHGIYTDMSVAGSSGTGFTLEEYKAFLSGTLNGTDIISLGQAAYFSELVNYMDDLFITDGKVDFDTPEFAELALYVKDNVPEKGMSFDNVPEAYYENFQYAKCDQIQGIADFLPKKNYSSFISEPTVLGMPSVDGRGPMFESVCSVAISSQATDIDACGGFISYLLSEDVQKGLAMRSNFVLNRSAFRSAGEALTDYFNYGDRSGNELSDDEKYTSADIDNIERIILSCSSMNSENSDMSMILIEEMPAYFLGQKDLDSVIKVAQDRVQKVLDERG